jgi:hypothetical protein
MAGMTKLQMNGFRDRLSELDHVLGQCYGQVDVATTCLELQGQFGMDFKDGGAQSRGVPVRKRKLKRI